MTHSSLRDTPHTLRNQVDADNGRMDMQGQIRLRAYELYEERGRRDGHQMEDWIQAEREVHDKFGLRKAA